MNAPRLLSALTFLSLSLTGLPGLAQTSPPLTVGMALDVGGKSDRSFNQAAWEGAQRAAHDLGVTVKLFEPTTDKRGTTSRGAEPLAKGGANLVIGVGFANKDSVVSAAQKYPGAKFAVVDDLPSGANTVGLRFREQEGSFLVGYIAAVTSRTGVVGFVGGQDVPLIHKFQAGYAAGVHFICPKCQVVSAYTGTTPKAWNDPATARSLAAKMQAQGADVIFAAAGGSNAGVVAQVNAAQCLKASGLPAGMVFKPNLFASLPLSAGYQKACAGETRPAFFIGVDSDQNYLGDDDKNPATLNHGLTSMVKRVDNAVYSIIRDVKKGKPWRSGDESFGLQNDGVGYALDSYNRPLISPALQTTLKTVQRLITIGTVKVPTQ
ncbi:BMP family lipoprotein [Deinococcus sp.]|uniref:BMP family lipoprotein n=1 Tax=Deinococcus sp. TaxID=47478 RepID=UPI003CC6B5C5